MGLNKIGAPFHCVKRPNLETGHGVSAGTTWSPNTDVYVTDGGLVIKVELAGMRKEDLELTVEGRQLRISGVRRDCCREPQCKFVVMEINFGPFETVLELPPGYDLSNARASYTNGFLRVDVPPLEVGPPRPFSVPIEP